MSCMYKSFTRKGFSLLEILITLSLIAILSTFGLSGAKSIGKWVAMNKTQELFTALEMALRQYKMDHGNWPTGLIGGEMRLNEADVNWKAELSPYFPGDLNVGELTDGFGNKDIRLVLDMDGDRSIDPVDMPGLPGGYLENNIWKQVAIFSLDSTGRVVVSNWEESGW